MLIAVKVTNIILLITLMVKLVMAMMIDNNNYGGKR